MPVTTPTRERDLSLAGPCISCGNPLTTRDQFCPACGRPRGKADGQIASTQSDQSVDRVELSEQRHFACPACGAEVNFGNESRSTVCPFCDTAYVADAPSTLDRPRPEFVIGFALTKDQAKQSFKQWLAQNSWFRPGDLAARAIEDRLRGIYLPFWSFAAKVNTDWSANIGEYWYETQTYRVKNSKGEWETRTRVVRHTEWWPLSGKRHDYWWGHFVLAGRGIRSDEVQLLMPYRTEALARFRPQYLAGWLCEECAIDMEAAWVSACEAYRIAEQEKTRRFLPGDTNDQLQVQTRWDRISEDLVLLPVYVISYRYGEKVYRFVINGQTGKCGGEKPLSATRITVFVIVIVLILLMIVGAMLLLSAAQR